jgi:hypothetical protein
MEGTVICARRAEGLVARAGSALRLAASGRGGIARDDVSEVAGLDGVLGVGTAFGLAATALGAGLALATGAAFLGMGFADFALAGDVFLDAALATGLGAGFLAGAFAAGFAAFFVAGFFAGAFFTAGLAAGLAFATGLVAFAPALGWGFTSCLLAAAACGLDSPAAADLLFSGDETPS